MLAKVYAITHFETLAVECFIPVAQVVCARDTTGFSSSPTNTYIKGKDGKERVSYSMPGFNMITHESSGSFYGVFLQLFLWHI